MAPRYTTQIHALETLAREHNDANRVETCWEVRGWADRLAYTDLAALPNIDLGPTGFCTFGAWERERRSEAGQYLSDWNRGFALAPAQIIAAMEIGKAGAKAAPTLWGCALCGCTDIHISAWVKANAPRIALDEEGPLMGAWCPRCAEHDHTRCGPVEVPKLDPYDPAAPPCECGHAQGNHERSGDLPGAPGAPFGRCVNAGCACGCYIGSR